MSLAGLLSPKIDPARVDRIFAGAIAAHWEWAVRGDTLWWSAPLPGLLPEGERPPKNRQELLLLVHDEDRERVRGAFASCVEAGGRFEVEFRARSNRFEPRWFRATALTHADKSGGVAYVSGELLDITQQRQDAELLREVERQLHQQERMETLDCFAGGIAHEFNNVLQAVRGYVAFAMDELRAGEQAHDDLHQALIATERAARLTRSLLDFARAEEAAGERYDVRHVLVDLDALIRPVIGGDVSFRTQVSPTPMVCGAPLPELKQALLNLCINARDAMPDGGQLAVTAEPFAVDELTAAVMPGVEPGWCCHLRVTDTGAGIPDDVVGKVFDPFFSTKEVGHGSGLGLATVYGFVQRNGGRVAVYSEPGHGTTFSIFLPIEEAEGMSNDPQSPELCADKTRLVLLIEDDPQVRDVGRRSLESAGYEVLVAADGETGLETYIDNVDRVELVVLDAVLPRLSGRRVFEEVRRLQSDVPVIFTTGFDPESTTGASRGQMADCTIGKPYDRPRLLSEVKKLIGCSTTPTPQLSGERLS